MRRNTVRFLITNDDGIYAPGIHALVDLLTKYGQVFVVAPNQERSGVSHGITVNRPLRIDKVTMFHSVDAAYVIDGTPADCVKLALEALKLDVDYVISGINAGANLGADIFYSGTVAAAFEGALQNIPSLAISLCHLEHNHPPHYDTAVHFLSEILFTVQLSCPPSGLLNINIPSLPLEQINGIKITKSSLSRYKNEFEERVDPRGKPYYWMKGVPFQPYASDDDDFSAVANHYVSITPLRIDPTDFSAIEQLQAALKRV